MNKILKSISGMLLFDAIFLGLLLFPQVRGKATAVIMFALCLSLMTFLSLVDNIKQFNTSNGEQRESIFTKALYYVGIVFALVGAIFLIIE